MHQIYLLYVLETSASFHKHTGPKHLRVYLASVVRSWVCAYVYKGGKFVVTTTTIYYKTILMFILLISFPVEKCIESVGSLS